MSRAGALNEGSGSRAFRAIAVMIVGVMAAVACRWTYRRIVAGDLVVDLRVGRSVRGLGPIDARIEAPRELVYEVIAAPYLGSMPAPRKEKIHVIERSDSMVLAAHRTPVRGDLVATTVETVRFEPPEVIHFNLVRGPVPHVVERFELTADGDATLFHYEGELGTDLWAVGRWWGDRVAERWEEVVRGSIAQVQRIAEMRAGRHGTDPS